MSNVEMITAAVYRRDFDALKAILKSGESDLNAPDEDGRTPLMHAVLAEKADPEMIRFLLDHGANPNLADKEQRWTALHFAARDQREKLVETLISAGASVDPVDVFGNTPLWRCVMNPSPNVKILRALIAAGADPARKNKYGVAPIDAARSMGKDDLVAILSS